MEKMREFQRLQAAERIKEKYFKINQKKY